jgi:hypothetical protein
MVMEVNWKLLRIWRLGMRRGGLMVLPGHEVGPFFFSPSSQTSTIPLLDFHLPPSSFHLTTSFVLSPCALDISNEMLTRIKLTIASNRPSVRSVFPSERKEEKKTRSGFSTYSNSTATPSKGKEKGRDSEITVKGSEREKEGSWGRKRGKRTPLLIKHLGGVERRKGESYDIRVLSCEDCRC